MRVSESGEGFAKLMSIRNLDRLFLPRTIAVIGASLRPHSVGYTVWRNLNSGSFRGRIFPVNIKHSMLDGVRCYSCVKDLPQPADLAVICTPPRTVPELIAQLGEVGTKAAIVLTAGLKGIVNDEGKTLQQAMLEAARPHLLRILGPNCVGMLIPGLGLNASFAHMAALPGKIAFVSQSGALVTGILDWAKSRSIGFSKFVSLGDSADVDFGDLLDYLSTDIETQAILLYIESIQHARKFMSAARAAARNKPVIVIKAGRVPEGAKAAVSHTGALAGSDAVYDAAIRRAGMLRVFSTEELFNAVETLARMKSFGGRQLIILTNGGGPGVMATDALISAGGQLAELSGQTLRELDAFLPSNWSRGNPVDIIGDAPIDRYLQTLEVLSRCEKDAAILLIHAPTAIVPSEEIARALAPMAVTLAQNLLSCWLGGDSVAGARQVFFQAGIPTYDTPEDGVSGYMQMVHYQRNQELLMQVPPAASNRPAIDRDKARALMREALRYGARTLSEPEAKALLGVYGIPVVDTRFASTPEQATEAAQAIGFPVALKIVSPQITHKSETGGVVLGLESADAVKQAAQSMLYRIGQSHPHADLQGFSVQAMLRRSHSHELIIGVASDQVFGPVIMVGQGGVAVEVVADHAFGLPPLDSVLARDMITRTRVYKLLRGYRHFPPADLDAVCDTLVRVSQLVCDMPELQELDINPLVVSSDGVIALDARISAAPCVDPCQALARLAIRPYPQEWEEKRSWQSREILIRPVKPEDAEEHIAFFHALEPDDVRFRMFGRVKELRRSQLTRLTQIDYDREITFVAIDPASQEKERILGAIQAVTDPDNINAEFAVIVRSDVKGKGLGTILMAKLIEYCRLRGTRYICGEALCYNQRMLRLAQRFGFSVNESPDSRTLGMQLDLDALRDVADQNPQG